MANWSQVKVDNVKVVSHERVEDTDPNTYCERGEYFFQQGQFAAAESEYVKALKLSNVDNTYVEKLLRFYYKTESKEYEKKADALYKIWYKKVHKASLYFSKSLGFLYVAYIGLSGNIFAGLFMLLIYSALFFTSRHKSLFVHTARGKMGRYIFKSILAGLFAVITCFVGCMMIYEGGEFVNTIYDLEQMDVVVYLGKIIGIASAVLGILFFHKWIAHYESKLKNSKGILKKLLQIVRIVGIVAILFLGGAFMYEDMSEWKYEKYQESHDGWLNDQELKKLKKLEKKYDALTDVDIRYFQRIEGDSNTQLEYDGWYIYLVYSSMGMSFDMGSRSVYSNVLTGDDLEEFGNQLKKIYNSDSTDYEKCEEYFELAYQTVRTIDLPESDVEEPDGGNSDMNTDVDTEDSLIGENSGADVENETPYWYINMQQIYEFLKEKYTLEEIEAKAGIKMSVKYDYLDLRIGKFYARAGEYTGECSYSQMFGSELANSLRWNCDQPLTEAIVLRGFGVERYGEEKNFQKFLWKNKMELMVAYEEDSTRIIFYLYHPQIADDEDIDYLALTEEEQRIYIASELQDNKDHFSYYNVGIVNGEIVSMYEYGDEVGAADFLIILFRDGTIARYYSEDDWTKLN